MSYQLTQRDITNYVAFPEYDVFYGDPPWEENMVKFFQTQMMKDTGSSPKHNIAAVLTAIFGKASTSKPIIIEYSKKGAESVCDCAVKHGHRYSFSIEREQANGHTFVMLFFNMEKVAVPSNLKGFALTKFVTQHFATLLGRKPVIFDPFAGIGLTCKTVVKAGGIYIGSELNPNRLQKAIDRMAKQR